MEQRTGPNNESLFVSNILERGTKGPFYVVFKDQEAAQRWGYYCSNCRSFDTAMDTMGRVVCNSCANLRRADVWDAAHE